MKSKLLIAVLCGFACAPAVAGYVNVVECRVSGGAQNSLFTLSGLATSTGKSTAAPLAGWTGGTLTGTGNYYAGDSTPVKFGEWSFTPAAGYGGYYDVYATWVNVTAAQNMPPIWTVNNAGTAVTASPSQTTGGNAWNLLGSGLLFNAGTTYTTRLATPGTGATGKRASFDSVAWAASTPGAVVNGGPADGAINVPLTGAGNDLSWTAGSFDSFFDIFVELDLGSPIRVASDLPGTTLSFDPDSLNLLPGTTYYWSVTAKNVDVTTPGPVWSFTTVPEPSTFGLGLLGGLGMAAWIARRRTA